MTLNFKMLVAAVAVFGVGLGVAFGAGIAYGRGDPKTVETGLTQQQIQSMLGLSGGASGGGSGAAAGGTGQRGNFGGGAATTAAANGTTGQVTAVNGNKVTIQTRTGEATINLGDTTKVTKLTDGAVTDLKTGDTIAVSGTRKEDGSYDASAISQVPADLQSLLIGGFTGGGSGGPPATGR